MQGQPPPYVVPSILRLSPVSPRCSQNTRPVICVNQRNQRTIITRSPSRAVENAPGYFGSAVCCRNLYTTLPANYTVAHGRTRFGN
jgi:hypothetical protein